LLDAAAKSHDLPLFQWLGGKYRDKVACTFWTGHRTTADAVRKAEEAFNAGYTCIKFKCNLDDPVVDWCEAIHSQFSRKISIILDPNERFLYAADTERIARGLASLGNVMYLEDPIARWDIESWAYLRKKISVPLSMHISLPYAEMGQMEQDAARAARIGATDYFNFNGGIYAFRRLTALSDLFEIPYSHGSEIDLGILEASYVHKAASSARAVLPSDIFGRLIREHDLLKTPLHIVNSHVSVPTGPGLGVELDSDALSHYSVAHWETDK
jgi:muconate cycloisomerase